MLCEETAHNPNFVYYLFTKYATNFQFNPLYWCKHPLSPAIPVSYFRQNTSITSEV